MIYLQNLLAALTVFLDIAIPIRHGPSGRS